MGSLIRNIDFVYTPQESTKRTRNSLSYQWSHPDAATHMFVLGLYRRINTLWQPTCQVIKCAIYKSLAVPLTPSFLTTLHKSCNVLVHCIFLRKFNHPSALLLLLIRRDATEWCARFNDLFSEPLHAYKTSAKHIKILKQQTSSINSELDRSLFTMAFARLF